MATNRGGSTVYLEMDGRREQHAQPEQDGENDADSGEDTDEASESELLTGTNNQHSVDERMEIREQMYQDKLANLLGQLELLKQGKHPEYLKIVDRLQLELDDRVLLNEVERDYLLACAERDCILEKAAAEKEFDEKKAELIENLIADLEDQKKMIEHEFATMELNGDSVDVKPTVTRKLRRRPNEPLPVPEKRRKPTTNQLTFLLEDKEVDHDLKLISRSKPNGGSQPTEGYGGSGAAPTGTGGQSNAQPSTETRIEDGKLWYERRWFHRGQPVHVEGRDIPRFPANISAIGTEAICVKKTSDGQKVRIFLSHLRRGKVSIKRRAN
ncbi:sin3 histone deacetylase corepressor complex component SDS3 [Anopheles arabiensis]|uniref:sin3 histone deacetylase corepressor complex component SDS3 n=1 Tax=Anopheles arabiensis TaxID=7173 RepID=UPI001AACB18A|nr:sin3 histone deacetylase corepressor complex component SDS3 [Anopheles arabiensis]